MVISGQICNVCGKSFFFITTKLAASAQNHRPTLPVDRVHCDRVHRLPRWGGVEVMERRAMMRELVAEAGAGGIARRAAITRLMSGAMPEPLNVSDRRPFSSPRACASPGSTGVILHGGNSPAGHSSKRSPLIRNGCEGRSRMAGVPGS